MLDNTKSLSDGPIQRTVVDRWIRKRLDQTIIKVHDHFASYRLDLAAQEIYEFTWHEFCDWYLELTKPVLQSDDYDEEYKRGTRKQLITILEEMLRLAHPLIPFVTEEIWLEVAPIAKVDGETIMTQPYPSGKQDTHDPTAVADVEWIKDFILGIRQIRGEMNINPTKLLPVIMQNASGEDGRRAREHLALLNRVGRVEKIDQLGDGKKPPPSAISLMGDMQLLVPMKGIIDVAAERDRLTKQKAKVEADLAKTQSKLGNQNFVNNAPEAVVTQERERESEFQKQLSRLAEQLGKLEQLGG